MVGINYTGNLPRYVLDRWVDNLTDKWCWNVDDRNNVDMLRIISRKTKSKFQLTNGGVFSITFAMSVIEKVAEFLKTLTMQYELRYKWWINAVVMILYTCTLLSLLIILLSEYYYVPIQKIKLCCWNLDSKWRSRFPYKVAGNAVLGDHSTVGLYYCSTEMVKASHCLYIHVCQFHWIIVVS